MKDGDIVRIKLLNDGTYGDMEHIQFPVEVQATYCKYSEMPGGGFDVPQSELYRIGCRENDGWPENVFWLDSECEVIQ